MLERRRARRAALQALFEIDQATHDADEVIACRIAQDDALSRTGVQLASSLVRGVLDHKDAIDAIIAQAARAWPIDQVAVTDRVALEIGVFELRFDRGTPLEVAIYEAVELAKVFGGDNSASFVNGVLRTITERSATHSLAH